MSINVQLSTEFSPDNVVFSKLRKNKMGGRAVYLSGPGNKKLHIQLPFMKAPYGLGSYTDEATKKTSYSLDLSLDPSNPEISDLEAKLKAFDEKILDTVVANSQEWLGKKYTKAVLQEALFKPLVRPSKNNDYPSTIKLKVLHDSKTGNFQAEAYDIKRNMVSVDTIEKGQNVMAIVDINQIWFVDNKFGVSVRLSQVLLEPSKKLPSFAFKGVSVSDAESQEDEDIEYEDVEVDE